MNLRLQDGFKKIKEDAKSVTLMHPKKHQIILAKSFLSPQDLENIKKLPQHKAKGGMIQKYDEGTPDQPVTADTSDQNASIDPSINSEKAAPTTVINVGTPQPMATMPAAGTPIPPQNLGIHQESQAPQFPEPAPAAQVAQAPQPPPNAEPDPYGANAYADVSKEGLKNVVGGIRGEALGEAAANQAQAGAMQPGLTGEQNNLNSFTNNQQAIMNEYQKTMSDIRNNMIDPNHYKNNMNLAQKMVTGIGLILGGAGTGGQGVNPMADMLNKAIDRDIAAQVSNQGQRSKMLDASIQQFGNVNQGAQFYATIQRGLMADQMKQMALKTGNPIVINRAMQQAGQFELQNNALMSQIAMRQTLQNGLPQQGGQQTTAGQLPADKQALNPATQIRLNSMSGYMSPEDKKTATQELGKKEEAQSFLDLYIKSFNDLNSQIANGTFSPADRKSAINILSGHLAKIAEGRFNLQEAVNQVDAILPRGLLEGGESASTSAKKPQRAFDLINSMTKTPMLDQYHIGEPLRLRQPTERPPVLK